MNKIMYIGLCLGFGITLAPIIIEFIVFIAIMSSKVIAMAVRLIINSILNLIRGDKNEE